MDYSYHFPYKDKYLGMIRLTETRDLDHLKIERYDIRSKCWVEDFDMAIIFTGRLPVKHITVEEAMRIIAEYESSDESNRER